MNIKQNDPMPERLTMLKAVPALALPVSEKAHPALAPFELLQSVPNGLPKNAFTAPVASL
jgi:hypothetical protein